MHEPSFSLVVGSARNERRAPVRIFVRISACTRRKDC